MITLNYATLRSDAFRLSLTRLVNCRDFDQQTAYRLMRVATDLEKHLRTSHEEWKALIIGKVKVGDNGQFKTNEANDDFEYEDGVDAEAVRASIREFGKKEISVERFKFPLEKLAPAKLSPSDLTILEPLIILDDVEA